MTLAYGVDPKKHDRAQARESVDWLLWKVAPPYMSYVPLVENDAERKDNLDLIFSRSGSPAPGPLSDLDLLSDPDV